jgi:hypothetical protein
MQNSIVFPKIIQRFLVVYKSKGVVFTTFEKIKDLF